MSEAATGSSPTRRRAASRLPTGEHLHAHLRIADTVVMLTQEDPKGGPAASAAARVASPVSLGGTTVILELYVDDVDWALKQAIAEGAQDRLTVSDTFWGDTYGWVQDPFGDIWALATVREELTAKEVEDRMIQFFARK
jgi:PhnB protein